MWLYFRVLYSVPLNHVSVFMPISYSFDDYILTIQFKIRECDAFSSALFAQDYFSYLGSFVVPTNLGFFFYFCEKCYWNVHKDYTESVDYLSSMNILRILPLLIYEHKVSFHLQVYLWDTEGSISDYLDCNNANSVNFFGFPVLMKVMFTL